MTILDPNLKVIREAALLTLLDHAAPLTVSELCQELQVAADAAEAQRLGAALCELERVGLLEREGARLRPSLPARAFHEMSVG